MERKVDIQELSNFLMVITTSMMGVGVHTARAVMECFPYCRVVRVWGYVTIFQKILP